MTDVLYRPNESAPPAPEPSIVEKVYEAPDSADYPSQDARDHLAVEESLRALQKQREERGSPWNPGPIVERKYTGKDAPEEISLKRANIDVAYTKRGEQADRQLAVAREMFGDFEPTREVLQATVDYAHHWGPDGIKSEPRKIGLKDIDGREIPPLDDRVPMRASDALPNARQAAMLQSNWRRPEPKRKPTLPPHLIKPKLTSWPLKCRSASGSKPKRHSNGRNRKSRRGKRRRRNSAVNRSWRKGSRASATLRPSSPRKSTDGTLGHTSSRRCAIKPLSTLWSALLPKGISNSWRLVSNVMLPHNV